MTNMFAFTRGLRTSCRGGSLGSIRFTFKSVQLTSLAFVLQARSDTPVVQPTMSLKEAVPCNEKSLEPRRAQRGDYWVLYNYVPMSMAVRCWESVTYTTHADYTFLDNLEPLLERWRAPISIAMHAPGTDFAATLDAIKYLRNCGSPLVSQLVTFHVFFSSKHVPKVVSTVATFCRSFLLSVGRFFHSPLLLPSSLSLPSLLRICWLEF